ncbi:MAG: glycerophosphodiester phosphodiesterase [Novosphingobium sp.]|nr:glycerophosphodiester phosphodiesterase [Novosphingobium sp.]
MLVDLIDRWRAPLPEPRKIAWLDAQVYAHRGLHGPHGLGPDLPENSLPAFAAAVEAGLGIECDVQRSGDGQPMIFHDFELDRMTGESGPLARRSADQLSRIALTGGDATIPSLRQMLDTVAGRVPVLIEIKTRADTRVAALCLAVRRGLEGYRGDHAVISFDPRVSHWFAVHSPLTARGLSFTDENDRTLMARLRRHCSLWHARPDFLTYDLEDLPNGFAAAQRKRGMKLVTWTVRTARDRERAAELADAWIAEGEGLA